MLTIVERRLEISDPFLALVRRGQRTMTTKGPAKLPIDALMFLTLLVCGGITALAQTPTLRANGKIAFTSDRDGNREIYVMNADGINQVRLTNNQVVDDHPTWSPDGTKIAFVSQRSSGAFAIFQMNADGTNKTEITPITFDLRFPIWDDWSMSWSPDGNRIVFQEPSAFPSDIFIVNKDGSNRHVLINGPEDERQPSWSPDGSRILFSRQVSTFFHHLYTIKPDGTDLQALEHLDPYRETDLASCWSPTGNMIAFRTFDYANPENIGISNADGSNRQEFDSGSLEPYYGGRDKPQWSPDGSMVIFQVTRGDTEIYVKNINGTGLTQVTNTPGNNFKPSWQPLVPMGCANPIDCPDFFIRQHYLDFLNREPDPEGLAFWTNEITSCGGDPQCIEVKRISVSASFFLSIEFQNTGYLIERMYKAAYGDATDTSTGLAVPIIKRAELTADSALVGRGVVVNQQGWEQKLEANKHDFALAFVQRQRFTDTYPTSLTPAQFVARLNQNVAGLLTQQETDALVAELSADATAVTRADVLMKVAANSAFDSRERNRAFVLMQYFGYLRRNPDDAPDGNFDGYNFWLNKLNQFNGNYIDAEMVKAFLSSIEYRSRFGP
jgi:Tol biopolymer transport system component